MFGRGASTVRYVECGVISASARKGRHARLAEIGRGLRDVLAEIRPDAVAMEDVFYGVNVQSTLALGEARGVAMFVAAEQGLSITGYPPATVKQTVVGHGRATKQQVGLPGARAAVAAPHAGARRGRRAGDRDLPRAAAERRGGAPRSRA